eukprot:12934346-Prorocentrum_lima.AAC.2
MSTPGGCVGRCLHALHTRPRSRLRRERRVLRTALRRARRRPMCEKPWVEIQGFLGIWGNSCLAKAMAAEIRAGTCADTSSA